MAFAQDEAKIRYAGSYLTGNAYTWFQPHVDQISGDLAFESFETFIKALAAAFDDPDAYATAERELESLKQDGSCAAYYAKMVSLFSQLGWTESKVQIHHFRLGLKDNVKDALVGKNPPQTFPEFATFCIILDNKLYARIRERKSKVPGHTQNFFSHPGSIGPPLQNIKPLQPSSIPPAQTSTPALHYDPMELDNSEAGKAARKAYRWANNLCGYCGKPGHKVVNCQTLATRSASSSPPKIANTEIEPTDDHSSIKLYEAKN